MRSLISATIAVLLLSGPPPRRASGQEKSVNPGINKPFENPDVAEFIKRFETNSREVYAQRVAIVDALGLRPGQAVADLGAGTGVFTGLIADKVGPRGKVYAVDIAKPFLDHVAAEAKKRGQTQVQTVRCPPDGTGLQPQSIDLAFICDVYHHLEFPAKSLASVHQALRQGGELVVVDFDRREGVSSAFVLEHIRASKDVFIKEIEAAGFERIATAKAPVLKETFFVRFRKHEPPTAPPSTPPKDPT
ncbi:MAG TPA: methyltransferase domain-containing protein [Isosphaeraceae bacterium]|nr:methyltransferase domain-containing protein [Isosphaeraceae bacterium]